MNYIWMGGLKSYKSVCIGHFFWNTLVHTVERYLTQMQFSDFTLRSLNCVVHTTTGSCLVLRWENWNSCPGHRAGWWWSWSERCGVQTQQFCNCFGFCTVGIVLQCDDLVQNVSYFSIDGYVQNTNTKSVECSDFDPKIIFPGIEHWCKAHFGKVRPVFVYLCLWRLLHGAKNWPLIICGLQKLPFPPISCLPERSM